jgi:hypothetical protein
VSSAATDVAHAVNGIVHPTTVSIVSLLQKEIAYSSQISCSGRLKLVTLIMHGE